MACLPLSQYGTNNAAIVASNMRSSLPSIRVGLMVGIGGGVPGDGFDIRLGDVVVGTTVIQYDLGKILPGERVQRTAIPKVAPHDLLNAVSKLRALHESMPSGVPSILEEMFHQRQRQQPTRKSYSPPWLRAWSRQCWPLTCGNQQHVKVSISLGPTNRRG
ncbi:uncharacterized protein LY79DRAFT_350236 [Colletotrichum navitas]|uniref:Nucleoside phosphorylase domain-containing protein n=1 Tax=Colletotrichum navitas TaxID=681940 RepID=A0AAD8Q7W5_9PEZI|nr:uncharacterized protein LY79DRAFT_350236 [Colletotrichum navitas]KAK1597608.1 hypothetical protein LY79DRAFT_350236 [Colletotrichum navitas]